MYSSLATAVFRRTAYAFGGVSVTGAAVVAAYASTEQGVGLRREIKFWSNAAPVVFDYWWHSSASSPYVKYQTVRNAMKPEQMVRRAITENEASISLQPEQGIIPSISRSDCAEEKKRRAALFEELHERNAPRIFQTMLQLGGLYIKLGQVLSVTALPVPRPYRELFRTLQSNVPGHEEFENVIKPTLERELGPVDEIFEYIEEIPCGSASIGQAHRAKLKSKKSNDVNDDDDSDAEVIIKVQYPDAVWKIPADIRCVGEFLQLCVYFGVVDESAAKLSYEEFARQFMAELDYLQERQNLQEVYESTLDSTAPYTQRNVVVPKVYPELCSKKVITMSYLPGPKFEEEARKQLESLGFDTNQGMRSIFHDADKESSSVPEIEPQRFHDSDLPQKTMDSLTVKSFRMAFAKAAGYLVGVDTILSFVRLLRRILLWSTVAGVKSINAFSSLSLVPKGWNEWAKENDNALSQARMLEWTCEAIDALFDVHGYQIFNQGLFNADCHPGNILIIQDEDTKYTTPKLGLIDYGQCKRLTREERAKVAKLLVSVADNESDEKIASHFRDLGVKTKNDSTKFLGRFARFIFGPFKPEHMKREWHRDLHEEDQVVYFPNELSMVYRTSMLLRGLAMSFQLNVSVAKKWRHHAVAATDQ